ncbi:hypothetical protein J6590_069361 [Homalodisca vitripennis]|nr:hypothetical protein J6590_069361 [Homalodisca vitripennis]
MDTDTGACVMDYNLKLPFKLRKRWAMEQKKADGTWLPQCLISSIMQIGKANIDHQNWRYYCEAPSTTTVRHWPRS